MAWLVIFSESVSVCRGGGRGEGGGMDCANKLSLIRPNLQKPKVDFMLICNVNISLLGACLKGALLLVSCIRRRPLFDLQITCNFYCQLIFPKSQARPSTWSSHLFHPWHNYICLTVNDTIARGAILPSMENPIHMLKYTEFTRQVRLTLQAWGLNGSFYPKGL